MQEIKEYTIRYLLMVVIFSVVGLVFLETETVVWMVKWLTLGYLLGIVIQYIWE